jgi:hypothetical protein
MSALAGLGLLLAACGDDGSPEAEPTPGATGTTTPDGDTVASCIVGEWRSDALSADTGGDPINADLTGGKGIMVRIDDSGATTIEFDDMEPVVFTTSVAGATVRGEFTYRGDATGTLSTSDPDGTSGSPTATGSPATTGTWQPVGDLNWADTKLTVKLTDPLRATPLDNVPIGQYTGDAAERTGDVVDIDPLFDNGTYRCSGDTLTVTPDDDGDLPWTLTRV